MLLPAPPLYPRKRTPRPRGNQPPAPPAPVALTLVAATYESGTAVVLTFDRAVDVAAFVGAAITFDDALDTGLVYDGQGGATLVDPLTVRVLLQSVGGSSGSVDVLNATASSGIVAVDDGGTWAGVIDLELPFP
jgi:hypothetical protein